MMDEYTFLAALSAVAIATLVGGIMLRQRLGPKIPLREKTGRNLAAIIAEDGPHGLAPEAATAR